VAAVHADRHSTHQTRHYPIVDTRQRIDGTVGHACARTRVPHIDLDFVAGPVKLRCGTQDAKTKDLVPKTVPLENQLQPKLTDSRATFA
jgi:hypothetical protein